MFIQQASCAPVAKAIIVLWLCLMMGCRAFASAKTGVDRQVPSPDYSVSDVVTIQLQALQANDDPFPNAGIETVFRFATLRNQSVTGPLPRFVQMVHGGFPELLKARSFLLLDALIEGNEALQPVELIAEDGREFRYLFYLRRQKSGDCSGCWRTDAVLPAESDQAAPVGSEAI